MAKKKSGGVNKSAAIRDYITANPDAKPKAILEALTAQGVATTTAFISSIKTAMNKADGKPVAKRGRPTGSTKKRSASRSKSSGSAAASRSTSKKPAASKSSGKEISVESIIRIKQVVEEMGSVEEARAALNALEKIIG